MLIAIAATQELHINGQVYFLDLGFYENIEFSGQRQIKSIHYQRSSHLTLVNTAAGDFTVAGFVTTLS